jgi:hypothetical protein
MATITEDYVSFEMAKLLVRKGFDFNAEYESYYTLEGVIVYFKDKTQDINIAPRITLQMAMKWLREVHNTNIDIVSVWNQKRFEYQVFIVTPKNAKHCYVDDKLYLSYEEAAEAGIKYCLDNLI